MSVELIVEVTFLKPFVFTAVAVTAGVLSIFLLFKFPSDSGRVNKESKKVSGPAGRGEAGVWRLRLYTCTVITGQTGGASPGQWRGDQW